MIVQSLTQKHYGNANFKPLANYVLRLGHPQGDPVEWGLGKTRETEAVAWAKAVNCTSPNLGWAIKEADLTQRLNKRAETSKSYHYVVSFPLGEQPPKAILENIEKVLSTAIGYGEHQRLVAVHKDTPHLHMHVVVNRVNPHTFRCPSMPFDHLTLQRTAAVLETQHGLQTENHTPGTRTLDRKAFQPSWQVQSAEEISPDLFEQYRSERHKAAQARTAALTALREKHLLEFRKLTAWHKQRRANAKAAKLNRGDRLATERYLQNAFSLDHTERKVREKREKEATKLQFPLMPSFETFRQEQLQRAAKQDYQCIRENAHLHFHPSVRPILGHDTV